MKYWSCLLQGTIAIGKDFHEDNKRPPHSRYPLRPDKFKLIQQILCALATI